MKAAELAARERIADDWPSDGLESVPLCPCCESASRTLAHEGVRDWSFYAAPGAWNYWECDQCASLYLDPRPTRETIGVAYGTYYTHTDQDRSSLVERLRQRVRNECWAAFHGIDLRPRLHVPAPLHRMLVPLRFRLSAPFHVEELARLKPATLLDVGCGNGYMLDIATRLGWDARGLELDPAAVASARALGLHVERGGYERLADFESSLDCILCSHVLEHVSEPRVLIRLAARALRPGGVLLLALPNATSLMRERFGDDWRGLEAPRHLSIPSSRQLALMLLEAGLAPSQRFGRGAWSATAAESSRIRRRGRTLNDADYSAAKRIVVTSADRTAARADFSEFVCVRERSHGS